MKTFTLVFAILVATSSYANGPQRKVVCRGPLMTMLGFTSLPSNTQPSTTLIPWDMTIRYYPVSIPGNLGAGVQKGQCAFFEGGMTQSNDGIDIRVPVTYEDPFTLEQILGANRFVSLKINMPPYTDVSATASDDKVIVLTVIPNTGQGSPAKWMIDRSSANPIVIAH